MISKFIKKSTIILTFCLIVAYFSTNFISLAINDCTVPEGASGCCPSCRGWMDYCFSQPVNTKCTADLGKCNCSGVWCNSTSIGTCANGLNKYQCDGCCCNLPSGVPGPGNIVAKGTHVGSECIYVSSNQWKIRSWGWACDENDYDHKTTIHFYLDDTGAINPDNIITAGTANNAVDYGAYASCGGIPDHGFDISGYTAVSGAHTISAYAIDIPTQTFNPKLDGSDKIVNCESCNPSDGTLSGWSNCSNGVQTSTCEGATSCPVGCTPGDSGCVSGSCSAECTGKGGTYDPSTNICTRNCLRVEGNIWSDDNFDGNPQQNEYWIGKSSSEGEFDCTPKYFDNFGLAVREKDEQEFLKPIENWFCHGTKNISYYHTTVPNNIKPESSIQVTLTDIMEGYKVDSWEYVKGGAGVSQSGPGNNTGDITMPKSGWVNVNWKLKQQTYNLTINVKKIKPEITDLPNSCKGDNIYDGPLSEASITVSDLDDNSIVCSGSSNSSGYLVCPIWILQGPLLIVATKTVGGVTPETFTLKCPNTGAYEYNPDLVSEGDSKTANIGLQANYKGGWVSAIDSDIFANSLNVVVPQGPTDNSDPNQTPQGFAKTLINSFSNNDNYLGFIFSESGDKSNPNVDTSCPNSKGFETTSCSVTSVAPEDLGGYSYNLNVSRVEHDSKWLENFTFLPPADAENYQLPETEDNFNFESGKIYRTESSYKESILPSTYSITGGDSVAVLYIDGDLLIDDSLTTISNGRLLIIVNGDVTIGSGVGTGVFKPSFDISLNPDIMAGIIARGIIGFESKGSITEFNHDAPVMVSAPLISKTSISFRRDLYHDTNATTPAESVKAFNKYLYLLTSLEREKSQDNLYFTGLTTYGLDWEYIY